jgi:hypothetical protein
MGTAGRFTPEKLVIGVLAGPSADRERLAALLAERWGPADLATPPMPFTFTGYYDGEMGTPIERFFVAFEPLVDPAGLARIKGETNGIEDLFRVDGRRKVNLDPGLLSLPRFVLATTKENAHRIPLSEGIYAEVTLLYGRGGFSPLPWTYPDYRSEAYLAILNGLRARYREQLRTLHPSNEK